MLSKKKWMEIGMRKENGDQRRKKRIGNYKLRNQDEQKINRDQERKMGIETRIRGMKKLMRNRNQERRMRIGGEKIDNWDGKVNGEEKLRKKNEEAQKWDLG